ncbi:hypothetical protein Barb4_02548 [Bacteroidales bacterium Barb4]|nr:hypothetical protein Barb4_02548 [Bacteroidales bacterium Barb4]
MFNGCCVVSGRKCLGLSSNSYKRTEKCSLQDVPKGQEISASHAAKRNVGSIEQLPISSERTTGYYMLHFISFFQNSPGGVVP